MQLLTRFLVPFSLVIVLLFSSICFAETSTEAAEEETPGGEVEEIWDPLEPVNRGMFWFNDHFDRYLFEPVARGYDWVMPRGVQNSFDRFFYNLAFPARFISSVIQFKFGQVGTQTGRFLINSTLGVVGLFDVADGFGMEKHDEDIGFRSALSWGASGAVSCSSDSWPLQSSRCDRIGR